jgi:hypothetical protein
MRTRDNADLSLVRERRELVDPAYRGQRAEVSQRERVWDILDFTGYEIDIEYLRELASQDYGRQITLGITLRLKQEWARDRGLVKEAVR